MFSKDKTYYIKVFTVDTELELTVTTNTTGMQLFNQICDTIGLRQIWFFGLKYSIDERSHDWVELRKKLLKQLQHAYQPDQLEFRAKYFPEDVSNELINEVTIRLFYLQVRESIMSGDMHCPYDTALLLASYTCQAQLGEYDPNLIQPGTIQIENLIPQRFISDCGQSRSQIEDTILHSYKQHRSMLRIEAMLEYLHIAQDLEMFGVTYFPITNKRGINLLLGVSACGLDVYPENNQLTPTLGFPWSEIANVRFKKHKFILQSIDKSSKDLVFLSKHIRDNQRLLGMCVGAHELYLRRRKKEPIELQHMRAQANAERAKEAKEREELREALRAKYEAELQIRNLEARVNAELLEQERIKKQTLELSRRVVELENKLDRESRVHEELETANFQLKSKNHQLKETYVRAATERDAILAEKIAMQAECSNPSKSVAYHSMSTNQIDKQHDIANTDIVHRTSPILSHRMTPRSTPIRYLLPPQLAPHKQDSGRNSLELPNNHGSSSTLGMSLNEFMQLDENQQSVRHGQLSHERTQSLSIGDEMGISHHDCQSTADVFGPFVYRTICSNSRYACSGHENGMNLENHSEKPCEYSIRPISTDLSEILTDSTNTRSHYEPSNTSIMTKESAFSHHHLLVRNSSRYRTLRKIRRGNTKKRVDQFESM